MEFHKYVDSWAWIKRLGLDKDVFDSREKFWDFQIKASEQMGNAFVFRQTALEKDWIGSERPYYQCFPAIIPMLLSLKLDLPCSAIKGMSIDPVELRLPVHDDSGLFSFTDPRNGNKHTVQSVLFGIQSVSSNVGSNELIPGLVICFDVGEKHDWGFPILSFKFFPLRADMSIHDAAELLPHHESWDKGLIVPREIMLNVVRLCACIALLDNDPELVMPDILSADNHKWDKATEEERKALIAKARKRGKYGFNIGAGLEVIPHFRRPHPALVWTGQGRTTPKIVMRKGSVVHRSKLTSVPHGFEGDSQDTPSAK